MSIKFGTDGWRGRTAEDYTFDNVRRCAQGFARYLIDKRVAKKGVVVGYDRRFASEHFAAAVAEVMVAAVGRVSRPDFLAEARLSMSEAFDECSRLIRLGLARTSGEGDP